MNPELAAPADAGVPDAGCEAPGPGVGDVGPFGALEPIEGAFLANVPAGATISEDDPSLTADLLEMYFNSNRDQPGSESFGIWVSKRACATDAWGEPIKLDVLGAATPNPTDPAISPDGLTIWLASPADNDNARQIYRST